MTSKSVPNIKELIMQGFCDDLNQLQIAEKLGFYRKTINKYVEEMKAEYEVKTVQGLVYKHLTTKS